MSLRHSFYRALFALKPGAPAAISDVAERLGVLPSTAKRYLKELVKHGLVREELDGKYVLTEDGDRLRRSILAYIDSSKPDKPYVFTDPATSAPIPLAIRGIEQLYALIKYDIIDWSVLEHHIRAGYLSSWIRDVIGDHDLAIMIDRLREEGRVNRDSVLELIEERIRIVKSAKNLRVSTGLDQNR